MSIATPQITVPGLVPGAAPDLAVEAGPRHVVWQPLLTGVAPGVAAAVHAGDTLRVAVVELPGRAHFSPEAVHRTLRRTTTWPVANACAALASLDGDASRPSIAVADVAPDGSVTLAVLDAPPAIVLSPDRAARALAPAGDGEPWTLGPDDALLLCSATFLEDPPSALSRVRGSALEPATLAELHESLAAAGRTGATALVRRHPGSPA
jgi:hypothetical protein